MTSDKEIENALLAIYGRLGTIEGKVNLLARADRADLLSLLEEVVRKDVLIGQIYLVLDGELSQGEVHEKLKEYGITPSQPTVSRRITKMEVEHGIAVLVQGGQTKIHRRDVEMERMLNVASNVRKWLADEKAVIPETPVRRPRKEKPA